MKPPSELQANHEVMTCPACGLAITARITVALEVGDPVLSGTGQSVNVKTATNLTRFTVNHPCPGRVEDGDPS